jgi:hypothetical protein
MRADLVALGVRLGWAAADEKEEPALESLRERLRREGEGLLLIYDNAVDAASLSPHLPVGGAARVLVTSNAHAWRGIAAPVEIRLWPRQIGADYLVARTGRQGERTWLRARRLDALAFELVSAGEVPPLSGAQLGASFLLCVLGSGVGNF